VKVKICPIGSVVTRYNNGETLDALSKDFGVTPAGISKAISRSGLPHRRGWGDKSKENIRGADNPFWRGGDVKMTALHEWVGSRKPKPEFCEECGLRPPFDLATIEDRYTRNLDDWEWLCRRCHMLKDGRMNNLRQFTTPQEENDVA